MFRKTAQVSTTVILSYLALILANIIWAGAGPVIKLTINYIPPFSFLFFRFLMVCIILLPYTLLELSKVKIPIKDLGKMALLGLFSQSSIIIVVWGLKYTTAVDAAIIGSIGVLMSMAAGHYFFNEKLHTGIIAGLILALIGTLFVVLEPLVNSTDTLTIQRLWGNILVFIYHLCFLLYVIWAKISLAPNVTIIKNAMHFLHIMPVKWQYSSGLITAISFYVGMASMLPFALLENFGWFGAQPFNLLALNSTSIVGVIYMALFSSIVAYFLFEWALSVVSVGDTAILGYLSAIFGIPFAFLLLGEVPTKANLVGAGIIAVGVVIAEVVAHFHKKEFFRKKRKGFY